MPYVALLLPVVLLAAACLLARLESRVCGDVSRSRRSRELEGERTARSLASRSGASWTGASRPAVAISTSGSVPTSGSVDLDAPTLRLVRDRSTPHAVAASAGPELRAAS